MTGRISVTAEVVGTGSDGTDPSVVFAVHRHGVYSNETTLLKHYLFNCGEGTQRLCGENGIKLNRLDSIFLTRLDVRSSSGIPGLVFALGGLGAAHLRVYGPNGTRSRLSAMESFVRRKYPTIKCVEVESSAPEDTKPNVTAIARTAWVPGQPQEDAYARIMAVPISGETETSAPACWICENCTPLQAKPASVSTSRPTCRRDNDLDPDRQWLRRYYESMGLHEKIPHMDTILRRYQGRMDELKVQLIHKYGNTNDSSESSSSDSDDGKDDHEKETSFDPSAPLDREWLERFYQQYEPAKVSRVDQILRQFAGREDQLKEMLLTKYGGTPMQATSPPTKKQKIDHSAENDETTTPTISIPEMFVDAMAQPLEPPLNASQESSGSLCYIIQFSSPPFPVVWIIDCQQVEHIDSLSSLLLPTECGHRPVLIVHFSSPRVVYHHNYQSWIKTLNGRASDQIVQHLVFDDSMVRSVNGGVFGFAFVASARNYLKNIGDESLPEFTRWQNLRKLLAPRTSSLDREDAQRPLQLRILSRFGEQAVPADIAQAKLKFTLQDTAIVDYSRTGWKDVVDRKSADDEDEVSRSVTRYQSSQPVVGRQLSILGTGSAAPSKLRASTSMYLSLSSEAVHGVMPGMLIDCGEGAYGQLQRQFDTNEALTKHFAGLKCIWISHHHADHQCGLLRVLDEYVRISDGLSTLYVIAPQSVLDYVKAWLPELPSQICLMTCVEMNDNHPIFQAHMSDYVVSMRSVRVWHCHDAFGLILHLRGGFKLVYSGDTKPCDQLVRAGMNASLLIHEATFDNSMESDADKKKHSTVGQAVDVAKCMRAKRLVLTHFSQRYPELPPPMNSVVDNSTALKIVCAYDGITLSLEEVV